MHKVLGALLVVVASFSSCNPPCTAYVATVADICHSADAGAILPNAPFVLKGFGTGTNLPCEVSIDGGLITLTVSGEYCPRGGFPWAPAQDKESAAVAVRTSCTIPALPAGNYTVATVPGVPATSVAVSASGDAGVVSCMD